MRNLNVVEKNAVFQLAGITHDRAFADDGRSSKKCAVTNLCAEIDDNVTADKIVVNVIGGGTFEDGTTSKTISGVSYSAFQTQTLTIKDATADTQIEFTSPSDVPSTRWFIDDICVTK